MFQRVAAATVFGQLSIGIIGVPLIIQDDIFHDRARANRIPDHRLILLAQVDRFGIAATFNIKYRTFAPAVLVVANKIALWISRERRFTGA